MKTKSLQLTGLVVGTLLLLLTGFSPNPIGTLPQEIPWSHSKKSLASDRVYFQQGEQKSTGQVPNSCYIVQPGDTLGGIAEKIYGNSDKWRVVWGMNPQISNPDLIYIGQIISIDPDVKILTPGKPIKLPPKVYTRQEVYNKIVRHMFKVNALPYYSRDDVELLFRQNVSMASDTKLRYQYSARGHFEKAKYYSKIIEFYQLMDGIQQACQYDKDYKMTALLTAVAWQETHFNNVTGRHGEITPFQFLPSTVKEMGDHDNIGLEVEKWNLLNSPDVAAARAYEWLQMNGCEKGNTIKALRWWNHGNGYADQVIWKYNQIIKLIKS